ncbi:MAG TPA: hypothetical protein VLG44_08050, partial [Chlamydiales bacterium]|nr:hypothetical protein [Chlamydiales bacterium]
MKQDHFSFEEEFHQKDRKQFRKERKIASKTDRSKFKKTDQKKKPEVHYKADSDTVRGRVLSITGEGILVDLGDKTILCSVRGSLKKEKTEAKNLVVVGDFVQIKDDAITAVEDRYSFLAREDITGRKIQLIASNID